MSTVCTNILMSTVVGQYFIQDQNGNIAMVVLLMHQFYVNWPLSLFDTNCFESYSSKHNSPLALGSPQQEHVQNIDRFTTCFVKSSLNFF